MEKTNCLRLIDLHNIKHNINEYDKNITNGVEIAKILKEDIDRVFKTLVTIANNKEHFVFVVPVNETLNLKKAAKAAKVKSIEMIPQKELLPLTGYIHGGCSPVGMKKEFKTFINDTAILFETIFVSAGRCGLQMEISPNDLKDFINADFIDLI